ncbi:hypothetical protein LCGC14_0974290 [marine sediment metagenome]|uniref:Uncharacterized protein n=1 Tax=marine sediment metagenome TaxID=412755 RepID=A0A0F9NF46_9ZZZZ
MKDFTTLDHHDTGDPCPVHDTPYRKVYTFGSQMSGETEVCTFRGCRCAVSIKHDPVGTYPASIAYHTSYNSASGRGRLHAMEMAAKYR